MEKSLSVTEERLMQPEISIIFQNLFVSCDKENKGIAKVSTFILVLKEKAPCNFNEYLEKLREILDPKGNDPFINWEQCAVGTERWLWYINNQNLNDNNRSDVVSTSTPVIPPQVVKYGLRAMKVPTRRLNTDSIEMKFTPVRRCPVVGVVSTYSTDSIDTSDLSWDSSDLQNRFDELDINNKKLFLENTKLKEDLQITEKGYAVIITDNEDLQKKVDKYSKLLCESKVALKGYQQMKSTGFESQNYQMELQEKCSDKEKEVTVLRAIVDKMKKKNLDMNSKFETIKEENIHLIEECSKSKEVTSRSEHMTSMIAELSLANELLVAEKTHTESELIELRETVFHGYSSANLIDSPLFKKLDHGSRSLCQEFADANQCYNEDSFKVSNDKEKSFFFEECCRKLKEKKKIAGSFLENSINQKSLKISGVSDLESQMWQNVNSFSEKFNVLSQEKQEAEKMASILRSSLKNVEEENRIMNDSREKALLKLGDLSVSTMENQEKRSKLSIQLDKQKGIVSELNEELSKVVDMHSIDILNRDKELSDLKAIIADLESINLDLTRKLFDSDDLIIIKDDDLLKVSENVIEKEKLMLLAQEKHKGELFSILELIPFDDVCERPSIVTFNIVTDNLLQFLEKCEHKNNLLKGLRDSPDGGSHFVDTSNEENLEPNEEKVIQTGTWVDEVTFTQRCGLQDDSSINSHHVTDEKPDSCIPNCNNGKETYIAPAPNIIEIDQTIYNYDHCDQYIDDDLLKAYRSLVVSFKTDQYTIGRRLDYQQRSRDTAESILDEDVFNISLIIKDFETIQDGENAIYCAVKKQIEVIRKSITRLSSQSEQYGCCQQENSVSPNIDTVIKFAENLQKHINYIEVELEVTKENLKNVVVCNNSNTLDLSVLSTVSDSKLLDDNNPKVSVSSECYNESDIDKSFANIVDGNNSSSSLGKLMCVFFKIFIAFFMFLFVLFLVVNVKVDYMKLHDILLEKFPHIIQSRRGGAYG